MKQGTTKSESDFDPILGFLTSGLRGTAVITDFLN